MSLKQQNQFSSVLIGGAIAVLVAIPVAAGIASIAGDTYSIRATVYILTLCWVIAGAVSLGYVSANAKSKTGIKAILLWIVSVWLWPILLWVYFSSRPKGQ